MSFLETLRNKASLLGKLRLPVGKKTKESAKSSQQDAHALEAARSGLGSSMKDLEQIFIRIGERIEEVDKVSRRLIEECENLIRTTSGNADGERLLKEALDILKGPLEYMDFVLTQQAGLLALLASCEQKTHGMLSVRRRMQDTIAPLTFMAVLYKIESAYLPDEFRETFLTVTSEVERLHHLVDETFARNAQQLDAAHATLASVRKHLETDFAHHTEVISAKRANIGTAITTLDTQLAENAQRDTRLHEHSTMLSHEVSKIVMGLQFQDIVKQKCDHVVEALDAASHGKLSWDQTVVLQLRQLQGIQGDLSEGCSNVVGGLQRIEEFTDQLNNSSVSLQNIESMTGAVDGMVQLLLDTFKDVYDIIQMVTKLTDEGHASVQPASELARDLTATIVELSINMRLIALNAQIRSVQSGQGTGLELLAARTAEISGEINDISQIISTELAQLHESIDRMLGMFSEFRQRGHAQIEGLDISRADTEARLHGLRDRMIGAIGAIGTEIDAMKLSTAQVRETFDEVKQVEAGMSVVVDALQAIVPKNLQVTHAQIDKLVTTYTMSSEREVHDDFISELRKSADSTAGSAPSASPSGASTPGSSTTPSEKEDKKTVTPVTTPASHHAATGGGNPLGENVELF